MKLRAIAASAMALLALGGIFASGAGAAVTMQPSAQELAAHPGMTYEVTCQTPEGASLANGTGEAAVGQANAEGKCTGAWVAETPAPTTAGKPSLLKAEHHKSHRRASHS